MTLKEKPDMTFAKVLEFVNNEYWATHGGRHKWMLKAMAEQIEANRKAIEELRALIAPVWDVEAILPRLPPVEM